MKYGILILTAITSAPAMADVYKCTAGSRVEYRAQPCAPAQTEQQLVTPPVDLEKQNAALAAAQASAERWQQQHAEQERASQTRQLAEQRRLRAWQREEFRLLQQQRRAALAEQKAQYHRNRARARFNDRHGMPRHIFDRPHLTDQE